MRVTRNDLIYALVPPEEDRKEETSQKWTDWEIYILARHSNDCDCDLCSEAIEMLSPLSGGKAREKRKSI